MKTEVYSWRVSTDVKTSLEREARRRKLPLSAILDLAAEEWLKKSAPADDDAEEQRPLHDSALKCFGSIQGAHPLRSERVAQTVRQRLQRR